MPRYFFTVHDGRTLTDDVGVVMLGLKEAQLASIRYAARLLETDDVRWEEDEWSMDVSDELGTILFTLAFSSGDLAGMKNAKDPTLRVG